jgi:wobble nucleotide-excising tRNase
MRDLLTRYQDRINRHLTDFGAGFQIQALRGVHSGGRTPRAQFLIEIRGVGIELEPRANQPSFQNALSDGDRRTLALAFFLARLDVDNRANEKIVVFDDPMASFDIYRKGHTVRAIQQLAGRCRQTIVLSHDPVFLHDLELAFNAASVPKVAHRIGWDAQEYGKFDGVDLAEICKQPYFQNYALIARFLAGEAGISEIEVARALRIVVEEFYKIRFAGNFGPPARLGTMIEEIIAAPADSPIAVLRPKLPDLNRFNEYASPFHHANPQVARAPIVTQVLRNYARAALSLVHDDGRYPVPQ